MTDHGLSEERMECQQCGLTCLPTLCCPRCNFDLCQDCERRRTAAAEATAKLREENERLRNDRDNKHRIALKFQDRAEQAERENERLRAAPGRLGRDGECGSSAGSPDTPSPGAARSLAHGMAYWQEQEADQRTRAEQAEQREREARAALEKAIVFLRNHKDMEGCCAKAAITELERLRDKRICR